MFDSQTGGAPRYLPIPRATPQGAGAGYAQYGGAYNPPQGPRPQPAPRPSYGPGDTAQQAQGNMASSAEFARARLIQAMRDGHLPSNFKVAQTKQNLIGQWHQLSGALGQNNPQNIMQALAGLGGQFAGYQGMGATPGPGGPSPEELTAEQGRQQQMMQLQQAAMASRYAGY